MASYMGFWVHQWYFLIPRWSMNLWSQHRHIKSDCFQSWTHYTTAKCKTKNKLAIVNIWFVVVPKRIILLFARIQNKQFVFLDRSARNRGTCKVGGPFVSLCHSNFLRRNLSFKYVQVATSHKRMHLSHCFASLKTLPYILQAQRKLINVHHNAENACINSKCKFDFKCQIVISHLNLALMPINRCYYKATTLFWANQGNFFENTTPWSKLMLKFHLHIRLKTQYNPPSIICMWQTRVFRTS